MVTMRRAFRRRGFKPTSTIGTPAYEVGDTIGYFKIQHYMGHSYINKRNNRTMSKAQHWYRCMCACGTPESRSQQELTDQRRQQCCFNCREKDNSNAN